MPMRRLLAFATLLAVGWGAAPAAARPGDAAAPNLLVPAVRIGGGAVAAVPAGVSPCCPHRVVRPGIVRTGGLGLPSPGPGGPPMMEPCRGCGAWELCAAELESAGAGMQTMALGNGVMYVFTADTPAGTRIVRTALARYQERLSELSMAGEGVHLCPFCRLMRGAVVSGKLTRKIIPIEGGCIALTTSTDSAVVAHIRAEAGIAPPPPRPKD